jgi:large conductance mechanosensitive channel
MLKEFREFAVRGNVLDLAVGIIIGGAFGTIVKSFVDDVMMPPLGLLIGGVDFSNLFLVLRDSPKLPGPYPSLQMAREAGAVTLNYGVFINTLVSFVLVAFAVFLLIRSINRYRTAAPPPAPTKECPECTSTIPLRAKRCPQCTAAVA